MLPDTDEFTCLHQTVKCWQNENALRPETAKSQLPAGFVFSVKFYFPKLLIVVEE